MAEVEHPHLAVMFTDIKGYSRMMSEDEGAALRVLTEHNQIMESVIEAHGGKIVKKLGDSYMVIFGQVDAAAKCGLHALTKIAARNRRNERALEIRVGVHEGAMLERDGDFFGENVNIAARLEKMARPMTIAASERVLQAIATRVKCVVRFVGARSLKNIRYPVSVYELAPAESWKLYLSADGPQVDDVQGDVLGDIGSAEAAWQQVGQLVEAGDLNAAARIADAALSRFGGTHGDYAQLAAIYLIARRAGDAQSILKMGEMLGRQTAEDDQLEWVRTLANSGEARWQSSSEALSACMASAQQYVSNHPEALSLRLLFEDTTAQLTGHLGGFTQLVQQRPDTAVVLRSYAEALQDHGRQADAFAMLERAIALAPGVADHHIRRVQWMVDSGDLEAVLAESQQLARRFPDEARVYEWTGKTRLLNLDPHGAQWVFEQGAESGGPHRLQAAQWQICSLMQQGRLERAQESAHKKLRNAVRQDLRRAAREYLKLATAGIFLEHWDGVLEILEEYQRYDAEWFFPQAMSIAAKVQRQLMPWERALAQLQALGQSFGEVPYPHPSALVALPLMPLARDADQWDRLHQLEFLKSNRDWMIDAQAVEAGILEARGALRFDRIDTWHSQLAGMLTHLRSRLDCRLPSLLALGGLIHARLNNLEGGKIHLEQACKLWHGADWPVWEIQQAESTLAAGTTAKTADP